MSAKAIAQTARAAGIRDPEQLVAFTMGFMSAKAKVTQNTAKVIPDKNAVKMQVCSMRITSGQMFSALYARLCLLIGISRKRC